eukprot:TRINITY_DN1179_c3_g1_i1.p1 TRINITY_DN1179_c3_g1~~TRINITY_DN1179_c3_g1_i1.p1  ORF type:complete len:221 (-),score=55.75 TRINITY_DN1179_c3_g1_i1:62-724(-)
MTNQYDKLFKIVLVSNHKGNDCLNIMLRFVDNSFDDSEEESLISQEFKKKKVKVNDDVTVMTQIWDLSWSIKDNVELTAQSYFKVAHGVVMVYSMHNRESFEEIRKLNDSMDRLTKQKSTRVLVGYYIDENDERVVETNEGKELADELGLYFMECSASLNENITELFEYLAKEIYANLGDISDNDEDTWSDTDTDSNHDDDDDSEKNSSEHKKETCCILF